MNLDRYKTHIFDCDGVILNSNQVKSQAFYDCAKPYGTNFAEEFLAYHVENGGISRYEKFHHFLRNILGTSDAINSELNSLLVDYATRVWDGLMACEIAGGLEELRETYNNARWMVASGGDQEELRSLFDARDIAKYFDFGIFGSPQDKKTILDVGVKTRRIRFPAIFFGDSAYDAECADHIGADFVYLKKWSEVNLENGNITFQDIRELVSPLVGKG